MTVLEKPAFPIASTMDTDAYQLFMSKLAREQFPGVKARYEFICRDENFEFPKGFAERLQLYVEGMADLTVTMNELQHFATDTTGHHYMGQEYMQWFSNFRFNPDQVHITQLGGQLHVMIEGPWHEAIFWETPLMALIVGLYNKMTPSRVEPIKGWEDKVISDAKLAKAAYEEFGWQFSEFGSRRRHSLAVQLRVLEILKEYAGNALRGTSNPYLAEKLNLEPVGTYAHQLVMAMAAIYGYPLANQKALEYWKTTFKGNLPAALTDTFTHEVFFRDFDPTVHDWIKIFRHDSGSEKEYRELVKSELLNKHLQPEQYGLLYTNGLTMEKAIAEGRETKKMGFASGNAGIGTYLSHELTGHSGLKIVIKPTAFFVPTEPDSKKGSWIPVAKLSQEPGKKSGSDQQAAMDAFGYIIQDDRGTKRYVEKKRIDQ